MRTRACRPAGFDHPLGGFISAVLPLPFPARSVSGIWPFRGFPLHRSSACLQASTLLPLDAVAILPSRNRMVLLQPLDFRVLFPAEVRGSLDFSILSWVSGPPGHSPRCPRIALSSHPLPFALSPRPVPREGRLGALRTLLQRGSRYSLEQAQPSWTFEPSGSLYFFGSARSGPMVLPRLFPRRCSPPASSV